MSYYSTYYRIRHSVFTNAGVFDGQMGEDVKMYVNPLLLRNCKEPEFENAYNDFLKYFEDILILANNVQQESIAKDICFNQLVKKFKFKEIPNTGLGYSERGGHGNGISGKLSQQLALNAVEIAKLGIKDPAIFTLLPLFEEGIGADRISDMTISILRAKFYAYTARKAQELVIPTSTFHNKITGECINLPKYGERYIILIPSSILTDLPIATDPSNIEDVSAYNSNLRNYICKEIGVSLKDFNEMHKNERKKNIFADYNRLMKILEKVSGANFKSYDFSKDPNLVYLPVILKEDVIDQNPINLPKLSENTVMTIVNKLCDSFKHLIESNRMSLLLFPNGHPVKESVVQRLFYTMSWLYCEVNNIDMNREPDPGCGELDFKFSTGAHKKVIVEIKLSSNTQLIHGLTTQLPIYMATENVEDGIYMVLRMSAADDCAIESLKNAYVNIPDSNSKPQLKIIDAVPRQSASKA